MSLIPFNLEHAKAGRVIRHRIYEHNGGRLYDVLPTGIRKPIVVVWDQDGAIPPTYDTHEAADLCHDADDGFVCPIDLAPGHNPDNLTNEIVGTKDGWRLLTVEEVQARQARISADPDKNWVNSNIESWLSYTARWECGFTGASQDYTYRTQKPPGFFLAPKTKTVNKTVADLPRRPFWVLRLEDTGDSSISYWASRNYRYAETLDGPWLPFTKEIPE